MDDAKPSLARRALAVVVLVVAAVVLFRIALGAITAVFWIVTLAALVVAAIWAVTTMKAGRRDRAVKKSATAGGLPAASHEQRVEAEMRRIEQQLRDQGRR
jgi:predicted membrane protein